MLSWKTGHFSFYVRTTLPAPQLLELTLFKLFKGLVWGCGLCVLHRGSHHPLIRFWEVGMASSFFSLLTIYLLQSTFLFFIKECKAWGVSVKMQSPQLHWESQIPKGISQQLLSSWRRTVIFRICLCLLLLPDLANRLILVRQNRVKHIPELGKCLVNKDLLCRQETWV